MAMRPCLVCAVLAAAAAAQVPPGYKVYENKMQRVLFHYPTAYEELPLPPTEQVTVARFLLKNKPEELKRLEDRVFEALKPQLEVFWFQLPGAATTSGSESGKEAPASPGTVREAMEKGGRVTSWDQFKKRFPAWRFDEDVKKPGTFTMTYATPWRATDTAPTGLLIRKEEGGAMFGVYGVALGEYQKPLLSQVAKMAASLKLAGEDAGDAAEAAIDKLYASGKYRAVEFRKKARSDLAKGWKALDTENFLIVHHSKNDALVKRIARDIEAMRAYYAEQFPPTAPVERLAIVRICQTRDEYHKYGGPPNTGGYWHPGNEELVFYDYSYTQKTLDDDERKRLGQVKLTDDDSLLVLYHEALHQYMHYAVGEFAPHDWFNEGFGDYFSGAQIGDANGRVLRIDPSPWRIHLAKDMCEFGDGFVPLQELLGAERAVFYHQKRIRNFYAAAWSFLFFLKQSKEAAANPKWSKMLMTYFETMKSSYAEQMGAIASPSLEQKTVAGFGARKAALKAALDGVDVAELERVWRKWVVDMKDPWPSKRPKHGK